MTNEKTTTISDQLRQAIADSGLTHYALGKAAGVAPAAIDRFVSGERSLRLDTVDKLCEALGLCLSEGYRFKG